MQINAFSNLILVEQKNYIYALSRKAIKGVVVSAEKNSWLNATKLDFQMLILDFIELFLYDEGSFVLYNRGLFSLYNRNGKN